MHQQRAAITCLLLHLSFFSSIARSLAFLKQFVQDEVSCQQIPSADFCLQQIFFLSADLFFVSKCLCRHHGNEAYAGVFSFTPAGFLTETFFSFCRYSCWLQSRLHLFGQTFQRRNHFRLMSGWRIC
jgi:hypothetical protein